MTDLQIILSRLTSAKEKIGCFLKNNYSEDGKLVVKEIDSMIIIATNFMMPAESQEKSIANIENKEVFKENCILFLNQVEKIKE